MKRIWILMKQEMMGWQWHQLDHMQTICTSLQTNNRASASSLIFTGRMLFLTPNQQCQSTEANIVTTVDRYMSETMSTFTLHIRCAQ